MKHYETIIIGAGASGLMVASLLPPKSAIVIESNSKIGAKLLISGGGKCNITNQKMGATYYLASPYFIEPALESFDNNALLQWLRQRGLNPIMRKEEQYFCPTSAKEIVQLLQKESQKQHFAMQERVISVEKYETYFSVNTDKQKIKCSRLVVASGGISYPQVGVSDIGYNIARHFGHSIITPSPALVGLTVQKPQFFFKELSGASMDVTITVEDQICKGSLLFTHKGISGPAVLDASLYWKKGEIEINFLPYFEWSSLESSNKLLSTLLPLPKRIIKAFLEEYNLEDIPAIKLSKSDLEKLKTLEKYRMSPAGNFGFAKAEVTRGGVSTEAINPYTMMSEKVEGVYFIGEVLDVTGRLGGYNFQWGFSSAFMCASGIKN